MPEFIELSLLSRIITYAVYYLYIQPAMLIIQITNAVSGPWHSHKPHEIKIKNQGTWPGQLNLKSRPQLADTSIETKSNAATKNTHP